MLDYTQQPPYNFLGLPDEYCSLANSKALVLPIPYEVTTSYKGGTKGGPEAIIRASSQVELFDREFGDEPALLYGIHTLPALASHFGSPDIAIEQIADTVTKILIHDKLLCVLGGEHSISAGIAKGIKTHFPSFVTVQLDAHADLRESYEGTRYSHACAARRISELSPVIQLGVRSYSAEEAEFQSQNSSLIKTIYAEDMQQDQAYLPWLADQIAGKDVFLTIDIDALDPSIMPSTGTPEPGGLGWYQILDIIRTVTDHGNVISFDCVELSPLAGVHAPDFFAAKLVYKTISLILHKRFNC